METSSRFEGGDWKFLDRNPVTGITRYVLDLGNGTSVMRTEYPHTEELFRINGEKQISSLNTRWGDGQIVASIPMNVLFNPEMGLSEAVSEGDDDFVNKWLNDSDHSKFRTRGGRL